MAMAMANPTPLPTFSSQSRTLTPNISVRSCRVTSHSRALALTATPACSIRLRVRATKDGSTPSHPLSEVLPYVAGEWRTIAKGWACAAAAVYCLSRTVPAAGRLPRALAAGVGGGVSAEVSRGVVALAAASYVQWGGAPAGGGAAGGSAPSTDASARGGSASGGGAAAAVVVVVVAAVLGPRGAATSPHQLSVALILELVGASEESCTAFILFSCSTLSLPSFQMGSISTAVAAALVVLVVAGLSTAATANVGDTCSTSADCGAGQWCIDCDPFAGSHCVRSTATNPFQLVNSSLPFNKYAYLTTHNSFAIVGEPSHTGIPRFTFDNQEDTVTDQLNNGVRALMLDTYDFKGDVWLCHSNGGKCNDFTAFEPALDTFKEIEAFLSANPSEIVTLILEDYVNAPNGLTNVFNAAGLQKYWFPVSKMPQSGQDWPLVSDMIASSQRLVVFTSKKSKQATEGIAYQWNFMVENNYGDDGMDAGKCSNRAESAPLNDKTKSLVLMNYFPSVPVKLTACLQHSNSLTDMVNTCYGAAGNRWANFIAVDYYKRSDGGGVFQDTDLLNGRLLCGCQDVNACPQGSTVVCSG